MAVKKKLGSKLPQREQLSALKFKSRHWTVGFMVSVSIVIAAVLMVLLQTWAFQAPLRWDLTSSGINSLKRGTEQVLSSLDDKTICLTSLYFETDLEEEDQKKYRKSVKDLFRLYQVENPSRIETAWINPLQEQTKLNQLMTRIRKMSQFADEAKPYQQAVEKFLNETRPKFKKDIEAFVSELGAIVTEGITQGPTPTAEIQNAINSWVEKAEYVAQNLEALQETVLPRYSDATRDLRDFYGQVGAKLGFFVDSYVQQAQLDAAMPDSAKDLLLRMKTKFAPWVERFKEEQDALQNLPPLELDRLERSIRPNANVIIVDSGDSAKAIAFEEVWPLVQEGRPGGSGSFEDRRFAGEGAITPTILQLIQDQQTAVVFVRYSGSPLFNAGGFGPMRQAPGVLTELKLQLEKLNFIVREWDLARATKPPEIDADLRRTIYVILRPQRSFDQRGMPTPQQLGPLERAAVLEQLTGEARAIFFTGWDLLVKSYEYDTYLKTKWGIDVDAENLIIQLGSIGPGQWSVRAEPLWMVNLEFDEHDLTAGLEYLSGGTRLPRCTPLKTLEELPEGVSIHQLVHTSPSEDIWAISNVATFQLRINANKNSKGVNYVERTEEDRLGPFPVVYLAEKENSKIAVWASDMATVGNRMLANQVFLSMSDGKLHTQRRAPGNLTLFVNLLHYLDDSAQWLHVASPVDSSRVAITEGELTFWRTIVVGVWPALAMLGGGLVWFLRRR